MRYFLKNALAALSLLILGVCSGCRVITYDRMPAGAPKGYAEFYSIGIHGTGMYTWGVYENISGKDKDVSGAVWSGWQRRRIATSPGQHTFIVKLDPGYVSTTIAVPENMIVPVRVVIQPQANEHGFYLSDNFSRFSMQLIPEAPVPFYK